MCTRYYSFPETCFEENTDLPFITMATAGGILGVVRASRPPFRSPHDCAAFALHSAFLSAGYSLVATGSRAASDLPEGQANEEVGSEGWNDMEDAYAFQYSGADQEGLCKYLVVKCVSIGETLMVDAAPDDGGNVKEPLHLEIKSSDYVTTSEGSNYGQIYKNLPELVDRINSTILSKLTATESTSTSSRENKDSKVLYQEDLEEADLGSHGPRIIESLPPSMPGMAYPPILSVETSDLLPGPGAGVFPNRAEPGFGGMLLGPNDPRWRLGIGNDGSEEFLDGGRGVPPGARFDPYGPPGVPGFEPNSFTRHRRPPGRGINPDLEHFQPY